MHEHKRHATLGDQCHARRPQSFGTPASRQACDDNRRRRHRYDETVLGCVGEHGLRSDADDSLRGERRVGKKPARVPLTPNWVGARPNKPQRRAECQREPRPELERRPVVLTAAERHEDALASPPVG